MFRNHEGAFYGLGTVGEKGQIVIPAKARGKYEINSGDKFIFFGHGPVLHLVKADNFNKMLDKITKRFSHGIAKLDKIKKDIEASPELKSRRSRIKKHNNKEGKQPE